MPSCELKAERREGPGHTSSWCGSVVSVGERQRQRRMACNCAVGGCYVERSKRVTFSTHKFRWFLAVIRTRPDERSEFVRGKRFFYATRPKKNLVDSTGWRRGVCGAYGVAAYSSQGQAQLVCGRWCTSRGGGSLDGPPDDPMTNRIAAAAEALGSSSISVAG